MKRIILEDGKMPQVEGDWTVGEVMAAAETLSRWVQSFHVNGQAPAEEPAKNRAQSAKEG